MDSLIKLNDLVDESDPDVDIPNIVHAFQTAEHIRKDHPNDDWFHLTGLIHDLGKVKQSINSSFKYCPYFQTAKSTSKDCPHDIISIIYL